MIEFTLILSFVVLQGARHDRVCANITFCSAPWSKP